MTHTEAYAQAAKEIGISRSKGKAFIEAYLKNMTTTLMDDQKPFRIEGLLSMKPVVREAHDSKIPKTGEVVRVPRKLVVRITRKAALEKVLE